MMETLRRFETKLDNAFIANIKQMFAVKLLANMAYSTNRSQKHPAFQKTLGELFKIFFLNVLTKILSILEFFLNKFQPNQVFTHHSICFYLKLGSLLKNSILKNFRSTPVWKITFVFVCFLIKSS